jgi:outer membrane protein insertion porin family/translocation and assembly module TamA
LRHSAARRGSQLACFAAVMIATPLAARAQDLSCGRGDVEVRSLQFRGNKAISDNELALRVTTTPSSLVRRSLRVLGARRCLNRLYLPRDLAGLELYYRERGFYDVKVDTVITPLGTDAVAVSFSIVEGPPTMLQSYRVTGLGGIADSASLMRSLRLRTGRPFDLGLFFADLDSITRRLRNSGYYRATTIRAHERIADSLIARAEIEIVPGRRQRFGVPVIHVDAVDQRGQQVPDDIVRRVMGIAPGTYYSDRAIIDAQRGLFQLGIYRHVEVEPLADSLQPPGDTVVVLDVRLSEDYMKRLDSDEGWGSLDCGRVRAQYADLNFAHSARRFEVTAQASKIGYGSPIAGDFSRGLCTWAAGISSTTVDGKNALESDSAFSSYLHYYGGVSIRQPRLLGTSWVPTLSLYSERRGEYKAYLRTTNVGADFSATRDIASRTQLRVGYSLEYGQTSAQPAVLCALFSRCDEASRSEISRRATLGVASATVSRTRTDNLVSPTRGTIMRMELRSSASPLLLTDSTLFFNKVSGDIGLYMPFGWHNVLSLRIRAGAVFGRRLNDPAPFVPPQERLYAGGASSLRGFQQNELGDVVYIARVRDVRRDTAAPPYRYSVPNTVPAVPYERVVPLGGNTLLVTNMEYRVRDPFISPALLQYIFFVDGGDAWNRPVPLSMKWTPGFGIRALTPLGPVQVNLGLNRYPRPSGPMYFEDATRAIGVRPDISPLYCVSPGNTIALDKSVDGVFTPPAIGGACPATYSPRSRRSSLTFTFSIGPDF